MATSCNSFGVVGLASTTQPDRLKAKRDSASKRKSLSGLGVTIGPFAPRSSHRIVPDDSFVLS